jgi:selenocysteine-specific elongation factor
VLVGLREDGAPAGVVSQAMDVWLQVLEHGPVGHRGAWHLHLGTAHREARVLPLLGDLQPGEQGPARLEVAGPVPVRAGDRFVLREVGRRITAAGGTVLEPAPARSRRGVSERLEHAEALEAVHDAGADAGLATALVALRGGATAMEELEAVIGRSLDATLADDARLTVIDGVVADRSCLERWQTAAVAAARAEAADDPVVTHDQLRSAVESDGCPRSVWPAVLRAVLASGEVEEVGGRVVHRDHLDVYRAGRRAREDRLVAALTSPELAFVDIDRVADEYGLARFELQPLLDDGQLLQRDGLLFTPDAVERAVAALDAGPGAGGAPFTASDARQAWGLTRRFALPLLEHLKATGRTTFDGTHHRRVAG